jgi:hypothetical protein
LGLRVYLLYAWFGAAKAGIALWLGLTVFTTALGCEAMVVLHLLFYLKLRYERTPQPGGKYWVVAAACIPSASVIFGYFGRNGVDSKKADNSANSPAHWNCARGGFGRMSACPVRGKDANTSVLTENLACGRFGNI